MELERKFMKLNINSSKCIFAQLQAGPELKRPDPRPPGPHGGEVPHPAPAQLLRPLQDEEVDQREAIPTCAKATANN